MTLPIVIKIPFRIFGYEAMSLCMFTLVYKNTKHLDILIRHEAIHYEQWKELYFVGFLARYLYYYIKLRGRGHNHRMAYNLNPFEMEAYAYDYVSDYLEVREKFAWKYYADRAEL